MKTKSVERNDYAKDKANEIRYIFEVERGKKGYWCLGCGEEMVAVHRTIENYKPYFRHDASNVSIARKCTYSSEQARRFLVMDILARTKRLKVPVLYKYSPDGKSKIVIEDAKFVEANTVRGNLNFYEDLDGNLRWGRDIPESCLELYRPDITFFDTQQKPVLLVTIAEKRIKVSDEMKVSLKSIGIDLVLVKPPKDTPEHIAESLATTTNTRWIYNYAEQHTTYIQLSRRDHEGISAADAEQMGFFKESFACRQSQINNLIRKIEKCLGTEHYRETERDLREESSRVGTATDRNRAELDNLRKQHRGRVETRYIGEISAIEQGESEFQFSLGATQEEVRATERNLEGRYNKKRDAIISRRREVEKFIREFDDIGESTRKIRAEQSVIEDQISDTEAKIVELSGVRESAPGRFEFLKEQEQSRFESEAERIRKALERIPERVDQGRNALFAAFERDRERTIAAVTDRDCTGNSEFAQKLKRIMDCRGTLFDWDNVQKPYDRSRAAYDCFRDRTYQSWH